MTDLEFLTKLLDLLRFCKKDYPMRMGVGDDLADMIEEVEQRIQDEESKTQP